MEACRLFRLGVARGCKKASGQGQGNQTAGEHGRMRHVLASLTDSTSCPFSAQREAARLLYHDSFDLGLLIFGPSGDATMIRG